MKGKINDAGILFIHRRGSMVKMECPFYSLEFYEDASPIKRFCGDWCPHFSLPNLRPSGEVPSEWHLKLTFDLEICYGKVIHFNDLKIEVPA